MTFSTLKELIDKNNIPHNVKLMSDSGWECGETDMDGVYYSKEDNQIVFTPYGSETERWENFFNYTFLGIKRLEDL